MNEKAAVGNAYDELAQRYAAQRSADWVGISALDQLIDALPSESRVLDAGCGQGVPVLRRLTNEQTTAVGMDISCEQLRLAAENAPTAALSRGNMTQLPFRESAFDAVTAFHSLIHVPIDEHRTVIDEFARVLSPGCQLLLTEGAQAWSGSNPDWLGSGVEMRWEMAGLESTKEQLRSAGFTIDSEWKLTDELAEEDGAWKPLVLARRDTRGTETI